MNNPKTPRELMFEQMDRIESKLDKLLKQKEWVQPKGVVFDEQPEKKEHISATYKLFDPEAKVDVVDGIDPWEEMR